MTRPPAPGPRDGRHQLLYVWYYVLVGGHPRHCVAATTVIAPSRTDALTQARGLVFPKWVQAGETTRERITRLPRGAPQPDGAA